MSDKPKDLPDGLFEAVIPDDGSEMEIHEFDFDCPPDDMSVEDIEELQRRVDDLHDPTRYVIASKIFWTVYYDVSTDCWCEDITSATLFKRKKYAEVVLYAMKDGDADDYDVLEVDSENLPKNERTGEEG